MMPSLSDSSVSQCTGHRPAQATWQLGCLFDDIFHTLRHVFLRKIRWRNCQISVYTISTVQKLALAAILSFIVILLFRRTRDDIDFTRSFTSQPWAEQLQNLRKLSLSSISPPKMMSHYLQLHHRRSSEIQSISIPHQVHKRILAQSNCHLESF
jgi:hypothetical protein